VRLATLVTLLLTLGLPAFAAADVPDNDGWVTDLAGFLTPQQERSLEALMESYKQGSDNEIALLTVPDLGGEPIERFALEVGRAWGIGEKGRNNAALLVVARDERKIRIEVARGLEGNLTDSISGRIIRNVIAPEFKQGQFYRGIRAGIEAMHAAAGGDYAAIPERRSRGKGSTIGGLIGPIFFFILMMILLRGRRGGGGRGGGVLPWLIAGSALSRGSRSSGWHSSGGGGFGGFGGFGGGGGFSGGGASGGW
jgi:uncharacterized protein